MDLRMFLQVQHLVDHPRGDAVDRHAHGLDDRLPLRRDLADAVDHMGGEGVFEQGELVALVIDLRRGKDGAGDVVDHIARVDHALKDVFVGGVLHHALQRLEHPLGVRGRQGGHLALQVQRMLQ